MTETRSIFLMALVLCLCACSASVPKQGDDDARYYQSISVMTPGVTGAHCFLQSGSMSYTAAANSRVMVRRAPEMMQVSCFKGSHMAGHASVQPTVAPREASRILGSNGQDCDSCRYPESVSVVLALRSQSVEKNNISIMR